jgi:hypothetical protein
MDDVIAAAARALAAGDPLGALDRVALRDDASALALRGIAMAQLGDLDRARVLVRRAARAFGPRHPVARARCVVAEGEIALAARDLAWSAQALNAARTTLEVHGDRDNARHAQNIALRRLVLMGRVAEAERVLAGLDPGPLPPALRTVHELLAAGIALRRLQAKMARAALERAGHAARRSGIPALVAEVEGAVSSLNTPAARLIAGGRERPLLLDEVEALLASPVLVVDACRHVVQGEDAVVSLSRRPVLFALARALGEVWPGDVPRDALIAHAFGGKRADESHRGRLRVEMARLRQALRSMADVRATARGFSLAPHGDGEVAVRAPPLDGKHAAVVACIADGEAWSSSALALATGSSARTVQRALDFLAAAGKVHPVGHGRARRWVAPPMVGFATPLLISCPLG